MRHQRTLIAASIVGIALAAAVTASAAGRHGLSPKEQLGKAFSSIPTLHAPRHGVRACHGPEVGFTGPMRRINAAGAAYEGAFQAGSATQAPTVAYAGDSRFFTSMPYRHFVGGMFWTARHRLDSRRPAAEQAQGPFLNRSNITMPSRDGRGEGAASTYPRSRAGWDLILLPANVRRL